MGGFNAGCVGAPAGASYNAALPIFKLMHVVTSGRLQDKVSLAVYLIGTLIVLLIATAATWMVARDYRIAVEHAAIHLDNVTVVVAGHTRFALQNAPRSIHERIALPVPPPAGEVSEAAVHRYLESFYTGIGLAYSGRVMLFRSDGALVAAFPPVAGARQSYADHPLFQLAKRSDHGSLEDTGILDGGERLIAYRTVRDYPVLVVVSTPMSEVLQNWKRDSAIVAAGALLFAALTAFAAFLLGRQWRLTTDLVEQSTERQTRLDSIIGSAMDAIITVDERQNIVLFNAAAEHIFKFGAKEAIGGSLDRFIPERYQKSHPAHVARFGESGVTMRRMGAAMVLSGLRSDGEEFPIDASISHVSVSGEKYFTVILRDITERQRSADDLRRSHQELRELYEAMHEVREGERTRIARELHDELAQWLTALKMDASWIASRLPREHQPLVTKAERMKGVVDNTVAAMRRIAADLRPVMLDDLGLVPAIENLLYDLSERTGVVVSLTGEKGEVDLQEPYATAVYRMVQEALTNVARHSGASSVEVQVEVRDSRLYVRIADNGRGFNPDPSRKSFGVLGIRERARTLGGSARVFSPDEGGTVVEIEIPYRTRTAEMAQ
ncbi:MAG: PAS domain S-box protein [Burkholderiales bacterium]